MKIHLIYGGAGTGKSFYLSKLINEAITSNRDVSVCCPTHSSTLNLYNKLGHHRELFHTVHSFFRINYENNNMLGPINRPEIIFIDEVCMLKRDLFTRLLLCLPETEFVICGDVLQLNPIYDTEPTITFDELRKYMTTFPNINIDIIEHDYTNIVSLPILRNAKKTLLTTNFRSNTKVMNIINDIFYNSKYSETIKNNSVPFYRLIHLITNEGYTFIASKYEILERVYKSVLSLPIDDANIKTKPITQKSKYFNKLLLKSNEHYYVAESENEHIKPNEILEYDDVKNMIKDVVLIPTQYYTAHKSQGLTIDKVIVCYDNLFNVSMLYTMCTRAANDLLFYSFDNNIKKLDDDIKRFYELSCFYNKLDMFKSK